MARSQSAIKKLHREIVQKDNILSISTNEKLVEADEIIAQQHYNC